MNREVLRTTIRKKLGETTSSFWEDSILHQWMNEAQLDVVEESLCKRNNTTVTTVASTPVYTLSTLVPSCLKILKVRVYNSSTEKWDHCIQKGYDFLDMDYPGWEDADVSTPLFYVYNVEQDEFILYPAADSDHVGTNYLKLYTVTKPTTIATDAASPDLPETLHRAVIEYVVATGLESRGYQDIADNHWAKYYGLVQKYGLRQNDQPDEEIIMRGGR